MTKHFYSLFITAALVLKQHKFPRQNDQQKPTYIPRTNLRTPSYRPLALRIAIYKLNTHLDPGNSSYLASMTL